MQEIRSCSLKRRTGFQPVRRESTEEPPGGTEFHEAGCRDVTLSELVGWATWKVGLLPQVLDHLLSGLLTLVDAVWDAHPLES